jgi:hypothetical protein
VHLAPPSTAKAAYPSRLVIAGLAVAGAGLFAMNAPAPAGPLVQHHDVQLVSTGEVDWTDFITNTETNLANIQAQDTTASTELTTALTNVSDHFSTQISSALTGFDTGVNNALFGGFYGGDDGYVFGLFGGEPVSGGPTPGITGSLLEVLSKDITNISGPNGGEQLYSDFNNYSLEVLDHTLKPLLAPLLDEGSGSTATLSIPVELSQIQTNLLESFGNYNELKELSQTVLSPEISAFFVLTSDIDNISAEFAGGDSADALSNLNSLGSDVLNAFVNGADVGTNPVDGTAELFPGLLTSLGTDLGLSSELDTSFIPTFITDLGTLAT